MASGDMAALTARIAALERDVQARLKELPPGASVPSDELDLALIELEILRSEMEASPDDPDPDEPESFVRVPLNRPPHLNSGAIALPQPD